MSANSQFFTNRSGLRLHYLSWGNPSGIAVVLLHGLRSYAQTWDGLANALGERYCCYALDQRGRGYSDWADAASYRTEAYVNDLEDLVVHLELRRFVLVGHSLGGTNALEYARLNPGRLQALVIEDIGPGSSVSGDGAERIRREMSQTPLLFPDWESAAQFWLQARPGLSQEGLASRLMYSMKETLAGIEWRHDQQGIAQARLSITPTDLWPAVRALDCPTLFIRGARSDFLPLATLESIKQANKWVRTEEIADASHYVHDDQSAMFNLVVMDYLYDQCLQPQQQSGE
ncbi:alpha/beta fold hydrolase [Pseudomonas kilonensis]|uniref:Pimeloyl-ACP methyl ester carboxylesterase n=1 Tax=Pseudomonas kilonensis TaxID=132476 RepID=A0ABY0ZEK6_9PSED|nr:alpha/beta hydrolase [Pseudomonas kilonensis]SEE57297.1 Pimeloyl-ACP methyl ester carboxylesterase [Pseudomonas kilonensis]